MNVFDLLKGMKLRTLRHEHGELALCDLSVCARCRRVYKVARGICVSCIPEGGVPEQKLVNLGALFEAHRRAIQTLELEFAKGHEFGLHAQPAIEVRGYNPQMLLKRGKRD